MLLAELQHFGTLLTRTPSNTRQNVQFAQNSVVKILTCSLLSSAQPSPDALQNRCKEPKARFSEIAGGVSEAVQRTSRWQSSLCHALTSSRARQGTAYGTLGALVGYLTLLISVVIFTCCSAASQFQVQHFALHGYQFTSFTLKMSTNSYH